ncbi:hypothetical protein L6452_38284 [Arctium lappa]|uniref:Uncharacterized protein n=1 Tax=Arctium lappa TaxID=4217 RepID=A0ACB8Y6H2_ARCLA|nr:hypothetical protein L6452_38284 [Arctium lappa]
MQKQVILVLYVHIWFYSIYLLIVVFKLLLSLMQYWFGFETGYHFFLGMHALIYLLHDMIVGPLQKGGGGGAIGGGHTEMHKMSCISRKSDSIDGIWYDTYEIDEIDIQIFLLRAY